MPSSPLAKAVAGLLIGHQGVTYAMSDITRDYVIWTNRVSRQQERLHLPILCDKAFQNRRGIEMTEFKEFPTPHLAERVNPLNEGEKRALENATDYNLRLALERSEAVAASAAAQLRTFMETTTDCVYTLDRNWCFTYLNRRASEEIAQGRDLIGAHIRSVFGELEDSPFWEQFNAAMNEQTSQTVEGYFPPLGGWFEVHTAVIDDGIVAFFRNIESRKAAERERAEDARRLHATLDTIPQMVWSMSPDGTDAYYNRRWRDFTGVDLTISDADVTRLDLVHPDDRALADERWNASMTNGEPYECSYRLRHKSGTYRWVLSRAQPQKSDDEAIVRWFGTSTDVHEAFLAKQALETSEARNRSIITSTPDCVSFLDQEGRIEYLNEAAERAFGMLTSEPMIGRSWIDEVGPGAREDARRAFDVARSGTVGHFTACHSDESVTVWWDIIIAPIAVRSGVPSGFVATARDITHQKIAEERANWTANHDALTGLANRTLFNSVLEQQLEDASACDCAAAVLMLDLDDFKRTNDALGHDAGDALLCVLAERLRDSVTDGNLIARLGGDEFAIILKTIEGQEDVERAAQSILAALKKPFVYDGKLLDLKVSIGASIFPQHTDCRSELLKSADLALYEVKSAGGGAYRLFSPEMRANLKARLNMLSTARSALDENLIASFYQPKINLRNRRVNGFEALLRWRDPSGKMRKPETIDAAFEDLTLAAEISDCMLDRVVADMRQWTDDGFNFGHVALNAAAAEFRRGDYAERILERLHKAQLVPSLLQVEITEKVFLGRGAEFVKTALHTLAAAGVQIALDDFGTGYASLSHLKQFPVHVIKIDRSFVRDLCIDEEDAAIVRAVIRLASSLDIAVVAEGIETEGQLSFLMKNRCQIGQGFLFGQAVSPKELPAVLTRWSGSGAISNNQRC
ncbi:EAL domain-containing protein [Altererythrobacter sp. SALINAS58]|uniref:sensor domain-containing protein n=1 Tax=Alteripontixanthobacter muriae TaxID=2705546 RepID=UPI0015774FAD|nr:bifunctional diguanylate cyclase/phosphodiesterase [Alteripontixanthobacter muriae]NTZ43344.1 EAL domain-containing protein [Alteripontixanthobacter muriae]